VVTFVKLTIKRIEHNPSYFYFGWPATPSKFCAPLNQHRT
jgi:hypothetical protein